MIIFNSILNYGLQEYQKVITFLRENCERNGWNLTEWLKIQSKVWTRLKAVL